MGYPCLPDIGLDVGGNWRCPWIDGYIEYAMGVSPMTPTLFHESAALWMVSTVIARRLHVTMSFDTIYPNLFLCWLAPTTLWNKTTGLNIARKIMRESFPYLLASQDMTPESLLADMSGREPTNLDSMTQEDQDLWRAERNYCAQRGMVMDEMSSLLASAGRDYNAGLLEAFLRFYDCDPLYVRSTRGQGRIVVRDSYMALIGASTPAAMSMYLRDERLWSLGLWPRFSLLSPEDSVPQWVEPKGTEEPQILRGRLREIMMRLPKETYPKRPSSLYVSIDKDAFDLWNRYNKAVRYDMIVQDDELDEKLYGTYGRSQIHALKVAMVVAAINWGTQNKVPQVTAGIMAYSIGIVEKWRMSAHRVLESAAQSDFSRMENAVVRVCTRLGPVGGASLRDLHAYEKSYSPVEIESTVQQLMKMGIVEMLVDDHGGKPGRPTIRYKMKQE